MANQIGNNISRETYKYSLFNFLGLISKIVISYLSIIFIFSLTARPNETTPQWSYFNLIYSCIIGITFFYYFLIPDLGNRGLAIVLGAFIFKLVLGTIHFVVFVQPQYFTGNSTYDFFMDYWWMHDSIEYMANQAKEVGFAHSLTLEYFVVNKGAFVWYILAPIYYYGGSFALNLCHMNSVFTIFTAIIVAYMSKNFWKLNKAQITTSLLLASFFPFGLITSCTMRDFAGQTIIAIGMLFLQFTIKNKKLFPLIIIVCFLFFIVRKNYVVIPIIAYLINLIISFKKSKTNFNKVVNGGMIVLTSCIVYLGYLYQSILTQADLIRTDLESQSTYSHDFTTIKFYLFLPIFILKGFVGPFPWVQFFNFTQGTIYQPNDYFTAAFIYTTLILLFIKRKELKNLNFKNDIVITASFIISFFGVASGVMHLVYIAVPIIFFIPIIASLYKSSSFFKIYSLVVFAFIILSALWVLLGFYNSDVWGQFRN